MTKRKFGFFNVDDNKREGVGFRTLSPKESLIKEFKELKEYVFQEIEDMKSEIRELRVKINEVLEQVV